MHTKLSYFFLLFILFPVCVYAQQGISGRVFDAKTKEAVPFATVRFGGGSEGMIAGLDGSFELPEAGRHADFIEVSSLGYKTQKIAALKDGMKIYLQPDDKMLSEVQVTPPYEKMRRIINNAIANKDQNNPDKYDWYRCHVYYKMLADATLPDSVLMDTAKDVREIKDFLDRQHLLMSETYSVRTWRKPQHLQEDVIASRFSGLKKSVFTSLVTGIVPFHAYNDYITMNGKDYHNPISKGFEQYYKFNLSDELIQGGDTVWVLSFIPNGLRSNRMTGKVYINSNGYAISHIIARANDTMLKLSVRIEQESELLPYTATEGRWFPSQLNYIIDWQQKANDTPVTIHLKGTSRIDSVSFTEDKSFRFDRSHTVRLMTRASELSDSAWKAIRPEPLNMKETETYHVIDSLGNEYHADKIVGYLSKLPEGKVPLGPVDVDLKRLISANKYENVRFGLGLQTNEEVIKWMSVGAWAGYGIEDGEWKYGVFTELYGDPYKEFVFRFGYSDDIEEPGRVRLSRDLDKNYLKMYLLRRVDEKRTWAASVKKRMGYWNVELTGSRQDIIPKYTYALEYKGTDHTEFTATEASINFRYAYAERTTPIFSYYTRQGTKYPIVYGKLTTGLLESAGGMQVPYTQATAAVQWHKHINRIGMEHFLVECGKSWCSDPLPLGKLFAGNGLKYDTRYNSGLYSFGGMITMYPYEYYTDQFFNVVIRHDFDWKLYKLESKKFIASSLPFISLQYDVLYGSMDNPEAQRYVGFFIPDQGYHEAGLLLNDILRVRLFNLYYLTQHIGYFYHIGDLPATNKDNGRFVVGLGIEL